MSAAAPETEAVWQQLGTDLRRFIARRVSDSHAADDLLQEVFLGIHRNIEDFREVDRLAAWVYQIARNAIGDYYRRRQRCGGETLAEVDVADVPEDRTGSRESTGKWLEELIAQLPDAYREVVQLAEMEGLTQREVAERLTLTLAATKSRIRRGRLMLTELLDACCTFQFDRRGNLTDCDPKAGGSVCHTCNEL